ncbi:MAG: peptidase [Ignavibacteriaceae bacterium]|nr:peptidase [Ignavibacteriaceae bacterium]
MKLSNLYLIVLLSSALMFAQGKKDIQMLKGKISQFVPVELKYDSTLLDQKEKMVVGKLYLASKIMDDIFQDQAYSKNAAVKTKLESSNGRFDKLALEYFNIMSGPFDRLDNDKPFYGKEKKPLGANFYPPKMSKDEFNQWINTHPKDKDAFTSELTVIRKDKGGLKAIPYSIFYKDKLDKASRLLKEAAEFCENPSLKKYLLLRAEAFGSNDYFDSDMAWMDVKDSKIEVVIGPYEVYEDNLFNYKAAFESYVTIKDPVESRKLEKFASYLSEIEDHLPIGQQYKNTGRGSESPMMVVNEIYSGGNANAGVQTLAFNLPNDEKVREAKGSKKVMLKNVHEAKFEKLLLPIANIVLEKDQLQYVTFEGFFNHSLMHEMSHGVGPGTITVNGVKTEVKKELKETYSTLEECKADILGMYNNIFMIEKGVYKKDFDKETYITFLASIFRTVRFGINEAHGGGNAIIYNYLLENGGYEYNSKTEKVSVNLEKIYPALKDLANKVLMIQATGNYDGAKIFIAKYAVLSPSMEKLRNKLSNLPVDVKPVFQIDEIK